MKYNSVFFDFSKSSRVASDIRCTCNPSFFAFKAIFSLCDKKK